MSTRHRFKDHRNLTGGGNCQGGPREAQGVDMVAVDVVEQQQQLAEALGVGQGDDDELLLAVEALQQEEEEEALQPAEVTEAEAAYARGLKYRDIMMESELKRVGVEADLLKAKGENKDMDYVRGLVKRKKHYKDKELRNKKLMRVSFLQAMDADITAEQREALFLTHKTGEGGGARRSSTRRRSTRRRSTRRRSTRRRSMRKKTRQKKRTGSKRKKKSHTRKR
jgi:hypothetical protein